MSSDKLTPITFFFKILKVQMLLFSLIPDHPLLSVFTLYSLRDMEKPCESPLDNIPREFIGILVWEALLQGDGSQAMIPGLAARTC